MKKIFCILSVLTILSPAFADTVAYPETADPGATTANAPVAANNPKYALKTAHTNDDNVASAGYVKGAYNATIKAVNTLNTVKQDKLTNTNVVTSGTGAVVTGVTANNGTVTVAKGEIQIPVGTSATNITDHAVVWIQ